MSRRLCAVADGLQSTIGVISKTTRQTVSMLSGLPMRHRIGVKPNVAVTYVRSRDDSHRHITIK